MHLFKNVMQGNRMSFDHVFSAPAITLQAEMHWVGIQKRAPGKSSAIWLRVSDFCNAQCGPNVNLASHPNGPLFFVLMGHNSLH